MYRVYLSAPITADTPEEEQINVEYALQVAYYLVEAGLAVYVPHITWYMDQLAKEHRLKEIGYGYLKQDMEWIASCNIILRLPDMPHRKSVGCEKEEVEARRLCKPILTTVCGLFNELIHLGVLNEDKIIGLWGDEWESCVEYCIVSILKERNKKLEVLANRVKLPELGPAEEFHGHPKFYGLLQKMADLHSSKNHDYAGRKDPLKNLRRCEQIGLPAWKGVLIRLMDKWERLENFAQSETLEVKNESVVDTLMDNAVYSLLCIILLEESNEKYGDSPLASSIEVALTTKQLETMLETSGHCPVSPLPSSYNTERMNILEKKGPQ